MAEASSSSASTSGKPVRKKSKWEDIDNVAADGGIAHLNSSSEKEESDLTNNPVIISVDADSPDDETDSGKNTRSRSFVSLARATIEDILMVSPYGYISHSRISG